MLSAQVLPQELNSLGTDGKQLILVLAVLAVEADKRAPFRFTQRQTALAGSDAAGQGADLAPPPTQAPDDSAPNAGPYPPSGQPASGPYPPSGWKPQGQRLQLPARQTTSQQYGAPAPANPQQQYGAPPSDDSSESVEAAEPTTESPEQAANSRLRQQVRQQRLLLQRLRQQLQQLRADPASANPVQLQSEQTSLTNGDYFVTLTDGRVQKIQYAKNPTSTSTVFQQEPASPLSAGRPSFVANFQVLDVPQVDAPVYSYSVPLVSQQMEP